MICVTRLNGKDMVVKVDEKGYPSSSLFKALNSWGVYARHIDGLTLKSVELEHVGTPANHRVFVEKSENVNLPDSLMNDSAIRK